MGRVVTDNLFVRIFRLLVLIDTDQIVITGNTKHGMPYIFLLLVYVANLEPNIGVGKGTGWVAEDTVKTHEAFVVLALLLIDDAEAEENLVLFIKV